MKKPTSVLAAVGMDQPGIGAALCTTLTQAECNIIKMTQSIIENQFACLFIIEKPATLTNEVLTKALQESAARNHLKLTVDVHDLTINPNLPADTEPFVVSVYGEDRNDIVGSFATLFADYNINIENLRALQSTKENLKDFMIVYEVQIPKAVDLKSFQQAMLEKARAMGLQATVQHRDIFEAVHRVHVY